MEEELYNRDIVCERLGISRQLLLRYEQHGLVEPRTVDSEVRYGRVEIRRAWAVVSLHRDLGINLAGVEAVLQLRARIDEADHQVRTLINFFEKTLAEQRQSPGDLP